MLESCIYEACNSAGGRWQQRAETVLGRRRRRLESGAPWARQGEKVREAAGLTVAAASPEPVLACRRRCRGGGDPDMVPLGPARREGERGGWILHDLDEAEGGGREEEGGVARFGKTRTTSQQNVRHPTSRFGRSGSLRANAYAVISGLVFFFFFFFFHDELPFLIVKSGRIKAKHFIQYTYRIMHTSSE